MERLENIKLIVADLDGTLLDETNRSIPICPLFYQP